MKREEGESASEVENEAIMETHDVGSGFLRRRSDRSGPYPGPRMKKPNLTCRLLHVRTGVGRKGKLPIVHGSWWPMVGQANQLVCYSLQYSSVGQRATPVSVKASIFITH